MEKDFKNPQSYFDNKLKRLILMIYLKKDLYIPLSDSKEIKKLTKNLEKKTSQQLFIISFYQKKDLYKMIKKEKFILEI